MNTDKTYAEQLASEYAPKDSSKVDELRRLDAKAKLPATITAYTLGVIASLILGVGMCLTMNVLGNGSNATFILGIVIGVIGLIGVSINYPLYKRLLSNGKQKYAQQIMNLAQEISAQ